MLARLSEPQQSRSGSLLVHSRAAHTRLHVISFQHSPLDSLFLLGYVLRKPSFSESDLCDSVNSPIAYMSFVHSGATCSHLFF